MQRFFAFPLVRIVLILIAFAPFVAMAIVLSRAPHGIWISIALSWFLAAALFGSIVLVERITAGRSLPRIGFAPRHAVRDLASGLLVGALLFSVVVLSLALAAAYRVTSVHFTPDLALAALLFVPGAIMEELLFRGVIFRLVEEWAGTWIGVAVSAVLFGFVHAANPGATWVSTVAIALEAGVLLAAAFVVTRNLWFPIALHFAWNYCEGPIFGTQVSGHVFLAGALTARMSGPVWLTGGTFGPEAGVIAILTSLAASAALFAVAHARGYIRAISVRNR